MYCKWVPRHTLRPTFHSTLPLFLARPLASLSSSLSCVIFGRNISEALRTSNSLEEIINTLCINIRFYPSSDFIFGSFNFFFLEYFSGTLHYCSISKGLEGYLSGKNNRSKFLLVQVDSWPPSARSLLLPLPSAASRVRGVCFFLSFQSSAFFQCFILLFHSSSLSFVYGCLFNHILTCFFCASS